MSKVIIHQRPARPRRLNPEGETTVGLHMFGRFPQRKEQAAPALPQHAQLFKPIAKTHGRNTRLDCFRNLAEGNEQSLNLRTWSRQRIPLMVSLLALTLTIYPRFHAAIGYRN